MTITKKQAIKAHRECVILWAGLSVMDSPYDGLGPPYIQEIKQRAIDALYQSGLLASSQYSATCPYCHTHRSTTNMGCICNTCPWPGNKKEETRCLNRNSLYEIWWNHPSKSNAMKVWMLLLTLDPCANINE